MTTEFDRLAPEYEALLKDPLRDYFAPESTFFVTRKLEVLLAFLRARAMDPHHATWLDVGCGKGQLLRTGRPSFGRVIGCDVSAEMIEACRDLDIARQVQPTRIPFDDASADIVTAVCVYHHIDPSDRAALTADIWRVLKPGGVFAIIEHNPLNPVVQVIIRRTPVDDNAILLSAGAARRLMRAASLHVEATRHFLYLPQRIYRRARLLERALERIPLGGQYAVFGLKSQS
jgi:SAM-dependent methyltransferase